MQKIILNTLAKIIIKPSFFVKFSAIKLGMLSKAMIKIIPTRRIEITMQNAISAIKR